MIQNTEDYDDWIEYIEDRPFNDLRYYISNKKVKKLGWKINVNFMDGLHELIHPGSKIWPDWNSETHSK